MKQCQRCGSIILLTKNGSCPYCGCQNPFASLGTTSWRMEA